MDLKSKITKILSLISLSLLIMSNTLVAQYPGAGGGGQGGNMQAMKIGRFYGKVVDDKNVGIPYATVSLYQSKMDTATKEMTPVLIDGQITDDNGGFSLEKLPIFGDFDLVVSYLGFTDLKKKVTFGLTRDKMKNMKPPTGAPGQGAPGAGFQLPADINTEIDLGSIPLIESSEVLDEVIVTGKKSNTVIALDKKIYRVDQDATAKGGTAQDALNNVPSLSIDFDGNVSLRNGSPQIFIDGRPTTLALNQIAADAIETVEVITNPSAKYDASGGQGGIVNIVLKKNRKLGYNGTISAGLDSQGGTNLGLNSNLQEGKINVFLNGFLNQRKGANFSETDRTNLFDIPNTLVSQRSSGNRNGTFGNIRGGLDWFLDKSNTLTFQGSYVRGSFNNPETLNVRTDTLLQQREAFSSYSRVSANERIFRNAGGSLLYKHLYAKKGRELTADANYNKVQFDNESYFTNTYQTTNLETRQKQAGGGGTSIYTLQADYVDQFANSVKFEAGIRGSNRRVDNTNFTYAFNDIINDWTRIPKPTDTYKYDDFVYAAYTNISKQSGKWGYQAGLRVESSNYKGKLTDGQQFSNSFPFSVFPSLFITRQINEEDNLQFSVARRINRPNFFQLLPFTDYSDSINLRRGNPDLIPEFTSSVELSYQNILNDNNNFLATIYYKQADNLITSYQFSELNPDNGLTNIITTYANSNKSQAYGFEFTMKNDLSKKVSLSSNANFYNSRVDASNVVDNLTNNQFTYFLKENITMTFPKLFNVQISGQYRSKTAYTPSDGGGGGGGRGGFGGGPSNSAQGYAKPFWYADIALSKSFMKNNALTLTLNVQDVFRTRIMGSFSESSYFIENSKRWSNFQVVRFNLSYRFGKSDFSLFKRKNNQQNAAGSDMMGG